MAVRIITPPKGTLVSLNDLKRHLRVSWTDEDDYINALNLAAQNLVETWTQRRYLAQVLEQVLDHWNDPMVLPVAPAAGSIGASITSVVYTASDGSTQTLDPSYYWDRPHGETRAVVRRWFVMYPWLGDGAERVVIRFAITGLQGDVPPGIQHAIKLLVSHWREHREAVSGVDGRDSAAPLPLGVRELLTAERWDG